MSPVLLSAMKCCRSRKRPLYFIIFRAGETRHRPFLHNQWDKEPVPPSSFLSAGVFAVLKLIEVPLISPLMMWASRCLRASMMLSPAFSRLLTSNTRLPVAVFLTKPLTIDPSKG